MKKRLFAVDGHALCYRAYFAFIRNPLMNSKGQNTSAIFGFARMLLKLIQDQKPDYLVVAFDPPKKSFRFAMYPDYKANRQKMPDDLRPQIEEIKNMLVTLGVRVVEEADYEADDVLGTIARKYASRDTEVLLVTGDKDAYQLVDEHVMIYANKKGISDFEMYDSRAVKAKLGLVPSQVIDYMALTGDSSDNIPGVIGIGEKTAQKLITEYGTLDGLYSRLDEIKGKLRETLEKNREMAYLSRDLVTIRADLSLDLDVEAARLPELSTRKAYEYFKGMEMESIARELQPTKDEAGEREGKGQARDYRIVRSREDLEEAVSAVRAAGTVSVDTETTSTDPVTAELVGISLSVRESAGWYIPVAHASLAGKEYLDPETAIGTLREVLEDGGIKKVGQNIKYDMIVLKNAGVTLRGVWFDTMIASYLLDPSERRHNLDDMAQKYLNYRTVRFKELVGRGKKAIPITEVPLDALADYAIEDADIAYRLSGLLAEGLARENLEQLFHGIEMPLAEVLADMELTGVKIDAGHFARLSVENERLLRDVEKKIYRAAGGEFNINSTRELSSVLFDKIGLKPVKKTKPGFSTDIQVLETLKGAHEIIDYLIDYRTLSKLKSTYIDTLPTLVNPATGRIHTSYNQTVVATGRLSSSDPNLQNIPVRDEFGKRIREGFVPEDGWLMMSADYSQIELRLAAHLSGDENMLETFRKGIDIHARTASSVFGVPLGVDKPGHAPAGEDHQFRNDLRGVGLRPLTAGGHLGQGGRRVHQALLRGIPPLPEVRGRDHRFRPGERIRADPAREAPAHAGNSISQPLHERGGGTRGRQHAPPGHRGRPDKEGHDRHTRGDREEAVPLEDAHPGARRARLRGAAGGEGALREDCPLENGRSHRAGCPHRGGRGMGKELGRRPLTRVSFRRGLASAAAGGIISASRFALLCTPARRKREIPRPRKITVSGRS